MILHCKTCNQNMQISETITPQQFDYLANNVLKYCCMNKIREYQKITNQQIGGIEY